MFKIYTWQSLEDFFGQPKEQVQEFRLQGSSKIGKIATIISALFVKNVCSNTFQGCLEIKVLWRGKISNGFKSKYILKQWEKKHNLFLKGWEGKCERYEIEMKTKIYLISNERSISRLLSSHPNLWRYVRWFSKIFGNIFVVENKIWLLLDTNKGGGRISDGRKDKFWSRTFTNWNKKGTSSHSTHSTYLGEPASLF